jgi:hypothetical protein
MYTKDDILIERREIIQALGAIEGVLLRGTWRNRAPPSIEDNLKHWRVLFLLDSRFRVNKSYTPAGVIGGLENEISSQLTDLIDNVRLSVQSKVWDGNVHRAWLRILNCATDVYNIRGMDGHNDNNDNQNNNNVDANSAFHVEQRSNDENVEFLYNSHAGFTTFTNPKVF